ncbi:uncharacterized protein LOC113237111 [Hyposmocoma kahamanoa]|uniref:uncharacterized protein LOC113237111 n=1 Tax=Hyposmocoma kahamanoa TaxID=1477025 RepID=UPI000E6D77DE|nr:uncharacterized protein LOC113237111 [Hyposmocoma kahamanoa]
MRTTEKPGEFEATQKMKFTKTQMEFNMKSIRFLLLTITSMFILNCCGRDSYVDYNGIQFPDNSTVFYRKNDTDMFLIELPRTCCRLAEGRLCSEIWSNGCKNAVARSLLHNSNRIGTLGVAAAFVQLLGTIFALNLARWIGKFKSGMPSVTSNTNDQIILARHGETKTTNKETTEEKCIDPDSSIS